MLFMFSHASATILNCFALCKNKTGFCKKKQYSNPLRRTGTALPTKTTHIRGKGAKSNVFLEYDSILHTNNRSNKASYLHLIIA